MSRPEHVLIFDTTLRDGEQAPGAAMTLGEKVQIAKALDQLGVDVIEAGFPISSPQQFEAVVAVAEIARRPIITALSRATHGDIEAAGRAIETAERGRIHTFIATSDIHLNAKFGDTKYGATLADKRETILRMTREAVAYAGTFTDDVEFSAEDAGRTDHGYLCEVIRAAVEAGATTINIPDTTGYCLPNEYGAFFETARECLVDYPNVILSAHCHDDMGLATANSLAAIAAGARQVECTINGIGERAGNAALEEIVMALRTRGDALGVTTGIDTGIVSQGLTPISRLVMASTGFPVQPNKAIVGRNAFAHEAGIHQHGVLKDRATYEILRAEDVGQEAQGIRLGRHSGRAGLMQRMDRIGIGADTLSDPDGLYARFLALADRKKEIFDQDLRNLLTHTPDMPKSAFELQSLHVVVTTGEEPQARVTVYERTTETTRTEQATGDGPIDALYAAIDAATGQPHELISYDIRSVSEGSDSVGEVTVLIGTDGAYFRGQSRHTDVIQASAFAYVEALNALEAHRADRESIAFAGSGIMDSFTGEETWRKGHASS